MEKDSHKTKVLFLQEREFKVSKGIFAYFPEMVHRGEIMTCYAHIGQHSACAPGYANKCKKATPDQYADLKAELESIGYNLEILTK